MVEELVRMKKRLAAVRQLVKADRPRVAVGDPRRYVNLEPGIFELAAPAIAIGAVKLWIKDPPHAAPRRKLRESTGTACQLSKIGASDYGRARGLGCAHFALKSAVSRDCPAYGLTRCARLSYVAEMSHDPIVLRPYQMDAVAWLRGRARAFIFDPAGLGKTLQAISAALGCGIPVVVVCPAVAVGVWQFELGRIAPHIQIRVQDSRKAVPAPKDGEWLITTYDRAAVTPRNLERFGVILDEAHLVKNPKTQRFKRVTTLIAQSRSFCWAMTGTPILKDPDDLWHLLTALGVAKQVYRTRAIFLACFGGAYTVRGLEWGKVKKTAWDALRPLMLRRDKQALLGLPPKLYEDWYLTLGAEDRQFFDDLAARFPAECAAWDTDSEPHLMQELARYSALKARLALPEIRETQGPVVVFSAHRAAALWLAEELGWPSITGMTSVDQRTAIAAQFQAGELPGLVCTIHAAGLALTLTRASTAIYVSRTWSGAVNEQSEDRLHRSGQTCEVRIIRCRTDSALEAQVDAVLRRKAKYLALPQSE